MIDDREVCVLLFVRAAKGSKRCYMPRDCWKDSPNTFARLDLTGPTQPRIEFVGVIATL